jgi:long-chain acyl-CoA synthetase
MTWTQLGLRVARVIKILLQFKLNVGEHVASCLPNSLAWIEFDLAVQSLGLVHVAIDPRDPIDLRSKLIRFSQARVLLTTSDREASHIVELQEVTSGRNVALGTAANQSPSAAELDAYRSLAASVHEQSPAQMLFTSGSTGRSKGVLLSHRNLISNAWGKLEAAPQYASDVRLNILPFSHGYARTCELSTWILTGGYLAIAADWSELVQRARRLQPTLMNLVPYLATKAAAQLECDRHAFGERLRLLQVGGAALDDRLWDRLVKLGHTPVQGYGLTEASPVVCSNRVGQQRHGSVGPAIANVELKVDQDSVLWCKGPNVMLGYWRQPAATAQAIQGGWLCTGDVARIDDCGLVTILGRKNQEIVLSTGHKVIPEPIESQLQQFPGIERAMLVGTGRPYVVALLWTGDKNLSPVDTSHNPSPPSRMAHNRATHESAPICDGEWEVALHSYLARSFRDLPRPSLPEKFCLVRQPLSLLQGTLTRKGTLRRKNIHQAHASQIDELYALSQADRSSPKADLGRSSRM